MSEVRSPLQLLERQQSNPLKTGLRLDRGPAELVQAIKNVPWDKDELRTLGRARARMSKLLQRRLAPTAKLVRIHRALQQMVSDGYDARDPRLACNAKSVFTLAKFQRTSESLDLLPWNESYCGGMYISGGSGSGKSAASESLYSQWPQVIEHAAGAGECSRLKQLVWLKVHMPADHHRGGFLLNAFESIDKVLGTDYARYTRLSIEKQLVKLLFVLAAHRCGVLIIEEAQNENLGATKPFTKEYLVFFMRLLNWGIPVLLIGNPLAFKALESHVQLKSRFTEYGKFKLENVRPDDPEWEAVWMRVLWAPFMTTERDEEVPNVAREVWNATGGNPRLLARLRRETERIAIEMGSERVTIAHVQLALRSESIEPLSDVVVAFTSDKPGRFSGFVDVDISDEENKLAEDEDQPAHSTSSASAAPPPAAPPPASARKAKAPAMDIAAQLASSQAAHQKAMARRAQR